MPETKQPQQRDPLVKTSEMVRLFGIVPMSAYTMRDTYEAELSRLREQVEQRITVEQAMEVYEEVVDEWIIDPDHGVMYNDGAFKELRMRLREALSKLTQR